MFSKPAVAGDLIFVGACNGIFYALDKSTAEVRWKYDITKDGNQRSFHVDPRVDNGTIYVGCDYGDYFKFRENRIGHLYAFDLKTGTVKWRYRVDRGVGTNPVFDHHDIFFVTVGDELVSLTKASGKLNWSFKMRGLVPGRFPKSTPVLDHNKIYYGSGDGWFYVFDKRNGRVIQKTNLGTGVYSASELTKHYIYLVGENRVLYRVDTRSLEVRGTSSVPERPWAPPVFFKGSVFFYSGKSLYCLYSELNNIKWKAQLNSSYGARNSVIVDDAIIVSSLDGYIRSLSTKTGSQNWEYKVEGRTMGGIAESDGVVYLGTREGVMYAIKL